MINVETTTEHGRVVFPLSAGFRTDRHGRLHIFDSAGREQAVFASAAWTVAYKTDALPSI